MTSFSISEVGSTFMPVETILKVDDNELLIEDTQKIDQSSSASNNYVSKGTQCDWKTEAVGNKICNLFPVNENTGTKLNILNSNDLPICERSAEEVPLVIRGWAAHSDPSVCSDQKIVIPAAFSQQYVCNFQTLPIDEKFFLQFDYKTRNKLKTKQRRLDPYYRTQERARQRTVMRIKRQDPRFRAAEREKGRYRMRLKRLDPVFRSQERERQRERMKMKRSNPDFREREREQQKTRLHVKRLDPAFKEKERTQDRLRMQMKQQNCELYPTIHSDKIETSSKTEGGIIVADNKTFKNPIESSVPELQNSQTVCPENINTRLFLKPGEINMEPFHFKKQHILNFNFYNSNKEQWTHHELCPKNMSQINASSGGEKLHSAVSESSIYVKSNLTVPKKTYLKHDTVSQNLMNIKKEELSNSEAEKDESSVNHESSTIPLFSLTPAPNK